MADAVFKTTFDPKDVKEIAAAFDRNYEAAAKAATASIRETTGKILIKGRFNIAHSGNFTGKWISGLQARQYPRKKASTHARVYINHRFGGLASVFEFGATIRPKRGRYMWILADGVAQSLRSKSADFAAGFAAKGKKAITPATLRQKLGTLDFAQSKTGLPMLGQYIGKGNKKRFKPYFIGVPSVTIHKRWSIIPIAEAEAEKVPARFLGALRDIG